MTVITEDFRRLDGVAPFPADLAFVYFTVPRRRQNSGGDWVVVPVEVKCRLAAGKLTSPNLDPGEATVRIGPHGPTYKIIIPTADTKLWELIETYEPADPPAVSLVKQYRDEVVQTKRDIDATLVDYGQTLTALTERAETAAGAAETDAGQVAQDRVAVADDRQVVSKARDDVLEAKTEVARIKNEVTSTKDGIDNTVTLVNESLATHGAQFTADRQASEQAAQTVTEQAGIATGAVTEATTKAGEAAGSAQDAKGFRDEAKQFRDQAQGAVTGVSSFEGVSGAVTKAQVGLDRVDNTRDADKPISGPTQQALTNLMDGVDAALSGISTRVDEKPTVAQAQALATAAVAAVVDNSPAALDTLAELAAALGNDPNFATTVMDLIGQKAAAVHKHSASDIEAGTLPVARGGIGRSAVVNGSYLRGMGTDAVEMRAPAQVLSDIGAASAGHTHTPEQVDGLVNEFSTVYGALTTKVNSHPGQTITYWSGTQAAYDALPAATRTAAGFIAAIY
ncbi:hypothetical protein ACFVWF_32285 [Rhodococcus qingshengii]|uniref:hypothetical protein n=1 Tax=Rhodococcus qingshengii TaxID=334542 RepID=UPI0036DDBEAA